MEAEDLGIDQGCWTERTVAWGTSVACTWSVAEASAAWTASTVPMRTRVASAGCRFRRNRSVRGFVPSSAAATALVMGIDMHDIDDLDFAVLRDSVGDVVYSVIGTAHGCAY